MGANTQGTSMAELIKSIELSSLILIKCEFEITDPKEAPNGGSIEISCEVGFPESELESEFEMISKFQIRGFRENEDLFILKLGFSGVFQELDRETFYGVSKKIQVQYCMTLVYPTLRENAQYILNKAGLGQVDIPIHFSMLNVEDIETNT